MRGKAVANSATAVQTELHVDGWAAGGVDGVSAGRDGAVVEGCGETLGGYATFAVDLLIGVLDHTAATRGAVQHIGGKWANLYRRVLSSNDILHTSTSRWLFWFRLVE